MMTALIYHDMDENAVEQFAEWVRERRKLFHENMKNAKAEDDKRHWWGKRDEMDAVLNQLMVIGAISD